MQTVRLNADFPNPVGVSASVLTWICSFAHMQEEEVRRNLSQHYLRALDTLGLVWISSDNRDFEDVFRERALEHDDFQSMMQYWEFEPTYPEPREHLVRYAKLKTKPKHLLDATDLVVLSKLCGYNCVVLSDVEERDVLVYHWQPEFAHCWWFVPRTPYSFYFLKAT